MIRNDEPIPWPLGKQPDCDKCSKPLIWTEKNREVYRQYKLAAMFGLTEDVTDHTKDMYILLNETEADIERILQARELAKIFGGVHG